MIKGLGGNMSKRKQLIENLKENLKEFVESLDNPVCKEPNSHIMINYDDAKCLLRLLNYLKNKKI